MQERKISVLLVDDSPVILAIFKKILSTAPDIQVVGSAHNGREAMTLIEKLKPQVVCTDLMMPEMDGMQLIAEIMATSPRPVIVISAHVGKDSGNVFKLLEAGALELVSKPRLDQERRHAEMAAEIINKIRIVSGVHVFRRPRREKPAHSDGGGQKGADQATAQAKMIVIGASTGGVQALGAILPALTADFPLPIICVQHISEGFLGGFVQWLAANCAMSVEIATEQGKPAPGVIYFPQEDRHLTVRSGMFVHTRGPAVKGIRPSITITMQSVAEAYGSGAVGVLLTGMGDDGADGMLKIASAGGMTIAQDEKSCIIFGMPKQAIDRGAVRQVLALNEIGAALKRLAGRR